MKLQPLTIISGPRASGKTILALQLLEGKKFVQTGNLFLTFQDQIKGDEEIIFLDEPYVNNGFVTLVIRSLCQKFFVYNKMERHQRRIENPKFVIITPKNHKLKMLSKENDILFTHFKLI